jgi:hypothetical protein
MHNLLFGCLMDGQHVAQPTDSLLLALTLSDLHFFKEISNQGMLGNQQVDDVAGGCCVDRSSGTGKLS